MQVKRGGHRSNVQTPTPGSQQYRAAIALTAETVHRRSRAYRALIIAVVILVAVAIVGALVTRSLRWTVAMLALFPMSAFFFMVDGLLVELWRRRVLQLWVDEAVDLPSFRTAMSAASALPTRTVRAMLDTLPVVEIQTRTEAATASKRLLASMVRAQNAFETYDSIATAGMLALSMTAVIGAAATGSWSPMLIIVAAPLLLIASRALARRALRMSRPTPSQLREAELNPGAFRSLAERLNWRGVPAKERDRFLTAVAATADPLAE
jgi:hypothetical protein